MANIRDCGEALGFGTIFYFVQKSISANRELASGSMSNLVGIQWSIIAGNVNGSLAPRLAELRVAVRVPKDQEDSMCILIGSGIGQPDPGSG